MGNYENKLHNPGVLTCHAKGNFSADELEKWREDIQEFIKGNTERGACGILLDLCEVEGFSTDAIDTLMEILADPEELGKDLRIRFALIGIRPFTQRFLREAMSNTDLKLIRARFFHEVAKKEALAWLQAMIDSAKELPEPVTTTAKVEEKPVKPKEPGKAKPDKPKEEVQAEAKASTPSPARVLLDRVRGTDEKKSKA